MRQLSEILAYNLIGIPKSQLYKQSGIYSNLILEMLSNGFENALTYFSETSSNIQDIYSRQVLEKNAVYILRCILSNNYNISSTGVAQSIT